MKRHENAIFIQAGACNPSGVAHSIVEACAECMGQGMGTRAICLDPAVRLMVHQLAYLCGTAEIDAGLTLYGDLLKACEAAK